MKTISELFDSAAKRYPCKIAVDCGQEHLTYRNLAKEVSKFTSLLLKSGLNYQDRVAIFLPNNPGFIISFFALAKIGAIAVTFNINYKEEELKNYLKSGKIKYLISDSQMSESYKRAIRAVGTKLIVIDVKSEPRLALERGGWDSAMVNSDDEALRQFSSGSTGKPKLAGRTHYNILSEAKNVCKTIGISGKDKLLCAVPLFHAYGFGTAMAPSIYAGATLILINKFNPRRVLKMLKNEEITIFFGVPYMFSLLSDITVDKKIKLPNLKYCFSAGISLPPEISRNFYRKFGVFVRDLYGTTETGCLSVNLGKHPESTLDSVGLPIKETKIKIVSSEIVVKTPTCANMYYIGNDKKQVLKNGYFYTGDIGKVDKKGNLYILGRKTTFINVAGTKVDPKEVEETIKKYPRVKEAVVLGYPDKLRGETVKAVIASGGNRLDKKRLLKFCRKRLADFKVPKIIEVRDKLPKSPLGKILKGYL